MNKWQKYPAYKDSGIKWLGEIPKEWEVKKLKFIMSNIQTGTTPTTNNRNFFDGKLNWFNPKDLNQEILIESENKLTHLALERKEIKLFPKDSILIVGIGATTGKTAYLIENGTFNQQITGFHSNTYNNKFIFYIMKNFSRFFLKIANYTTLPILNNEFFKSLLLAIPPKQEQEKIALYLDKKTSQIDKVINQKEKLIELLKEYRQIIINEAVTKGVDENGKLRIDNGDFKDSGIEWIGRIPKHWEIRKIKYLGKFVNGYSFNSEEFTDKGIKVMKISNIQHMAVDWADSSYISEQYYYKLKQFRVNKNDLVFALTRPIISTGIKATIIQETEKILLNQRNTMLKPSNSVLTKWLYYIILNNNFIQTFNNLIDKTGQQPNISTNDIGNIKIPLPPKQEQEKIVKYIDNQTTKIDKAIRLQKNYIEKLKEYKATLIDSVVTGKVRVV